MARTVQLWRDEAPPAPMLATPCELDALNLDNSSHLYEQKFDGIRAIVIVEPAHPTARVRILSRNGNDKAAQFPEIVRALRELAAQLSGTVILDGEVVALDARGRPTSFTRAAVPHAPDGRARHRRPVGTVPTALIVFDLLREGQEDLRPLPLAARRARLEHLLHVRTSERLREGLYVAGDGRRVLAQARTRGLGGPDRQGRRRALPVGRAVADVAQGQAAQARDARHRRLDRSQGHARRLRGADGRPPHRCARQAGATGEGQRRDAVLRRQCRHRVQRRRDLGSPACACGRWPAPRRPSSMPHGPADSTGSSHACSAKCASASGRPRGDCVIPCSSACVTTSAWRASDGLVTGSRTNAERRTPTPQTRPPDADAAGVAVACAWSGWPGPTRPC